VNQLTKQLMSIPSTNVAAQKPLIKQILQIAMIDDFPHILTGRTIKGSIYKTSKVKNVKTYAGGTVDFAAIWIKK
jgi:hypothetical protein